MTENNYHRGVDVSSIQGAIDYGWLKAQGISFVVVKCGNGNDGIDGDYNKNVAAAKAAGLLVACYNVVYPLPVPADPTANQSLRDPIKQAQYHFNAAGPGVVAACDLEWPLPGAGWTGYGCSASQIAAWTLAYLAEYSRLNGQKMVLYSYPSFMESVGFSSEITQYPLWIASYTNSPAIPKPYTDWAWWQQAGGSAMKLPNGVPIDTNYAKDLSLWEVQPVAAPVPVPVITPMLVPAPQPVPNASTTTNQSTPSGFLTIVKTLMTQLLKLFQR